MSDVIPSPPPPPSDDFWWKSATDKLGARGAHSGPPLGFDRFRSQSVSSPSGPPCCPTRASTKMTSLVVLLPLVLFRDETQYKKKVCVLI